MTSILTNSAALSALSTLRSIDASMENTQRAISSGFRVGSAADNAAYWSIATTMRSDNQALSTVQDALGLAAAKTDTAYSGLDTSIKLISEIKAKLTAAREPGVDKDKVQKEIAELKAQLVSVATSASFSSENWLYYNTSGGAGVGTKEMVGSFIRSDANTVSVQTVNYDASKSVLIDAANASRGQLTKGVQVATGVTYFLLNATTTNGVLGNEVTINSGTSNTDISYMISAVDSMLKSVTDAAATLGAVNSRITNQNEFIQNLTDVIDKGIGRLVDADMNEESTRLKALQTQQQLGIQALSIANSASSNMMQLFR